MKIESLTKDIILGIENTFEIDTTNAGNVPLEVHMTSPSNVYGKNMNSLIFQNLFFNLKIVPCKIDELSKIKKIHFTPTEIGLYHLNVKFGSDTIPGRNFFLFLIILFL